MSYKTFEGKLQAEGFKFGLVVSRFNNFLTDKLLEGAMDCLVRHGAIEENISVAYCPGAFEVPYVAARMAKSGKYDAIVCLGAIIRGETPHFNYIASETTKGVAKLALDTNIPIMYGIITADTLEQAIERSGTKAGNKGWYAAEAAVELVNLYQLLSENV
ncbi:MAG: 6,7-dimethyl-8-ribityllumazine synthase [candidate division Zixibacteria bacterium]|nr:6,7-dimethyl-8-ribityllumazine synthase [candidate division Zixibacteria bacterium]